MTLKEDIQAAIQAADMQAGVSVWHIESGEQIDVDGDSLYPMASVFKIPVLALAGKQIQEGKLKLDDLISHHVHGSQLGAMYDGLLNRKDEFLLVTLHW